VTSPFTVTFSCESCPSNASTDFIIRGTPSISPNAPSRPGFDVFNMISGTCAGPNSARSRDDSTLNLARRRRPAAV
jgi:hypothetical protein